ncbi:hypothetical protein GGS21DRAFT_547698 [Xylaria nigripes]|nr:hypothetical protein GGS21DRAFT_547698 [Xylaria nigripes]
MNQTPDPTQVALTGQLAVIASIITWLILTLTIWIMMAFQLYHSQAQQPADTEAGYGVALTNQDLSLEEVLSKNRPSSPLSPASGLSLACTGVARASTRAQSSRSGIPQDSECYAGEGPVGHIFSRLGRRLRRFFKKDQHVLPVTSEKSVKSFHTLEPGPPFAPNPRTSSDGGFAFRESRKVPRVVRTRSQVGEPSREIKASMATPRTIGAQIEVSGPPGGTEEAPVEVPQEARAQSKGSEIRISHETQEASREAVQEAPHGSAPSAGPVPQAIPEAEPQAEPQAEHEVAPQAEPQTAPPSTVKRPESAELSDSQIPGMAI